MAGILVIAETVENERTVPAPVRKCMMESLENDGIWVSRYTRCVGPEGNLSVVDNL